jgi:DnaK suppressor protein
MLTPEPPAEPESSRCEESPVSKITAAKAHPAKPATKKKAATPAPRSAKPVAKKSSSSAKSAARPAARAPAKTAARKSTAARPAAKAPAGKTPAKKTPAHAAPRKAAAHAPPPAPAKAPTKTPVVKITEPSPKPAAAAAAPATAKPHRAPSPRSSKTPVVMPQSPPSTLISSRFADRFAPPKPPTRQMNHLGGEDIVKQAYKADPKLANVWKTKPGRDLSEAELLSMPDGEYMNDKQLEFFRARLQALKDDLLSNAGETTEHLREDTSIVPDPADRATIEEEHALELRTRDRERKLLKKISQSLARIDAGDYGFCDETGEPIGLGRLIARPTATLSLEAQQRRELKQKMFGD